MSTSVSDTRAERGFHLEIFLMAFASLLLEIAYTRVISFKLFYYYTYFVIGLALLGIGFGGVLVAVSGRLRRSSTDAVVTGGLLFGAASVGVGYVVVAKLAIDTLAIWDYGTRASVVNTVSLVLVSVALFASFVAVGVMLATLFGRRAERIGRLYFADLVGAGLACAVAVWFLDRRGAPATIMLSGAVLAAAGVRLAWRRDARASMAIGAILLVVLGTGFVRPSVLPDPRVDERKHMRNPDGLYTRWSALFRVDAADVREDVKLLFHDALLGSAMHRWDGDPASLGRFDADPRSFPFARSTDPAESVLIIGAAGGNEVLAAIRFDAREIDAVELNPVTHRMVTDVFADYAGRVAEYPGVDFVRGDGRTFLARRDKRYDVIWYPAPDSYSATNAATSGAFVLSESYLYTSEMIEESLDHLRDGGIVAAQFGEVHYRTKPNRTSRYLTTVRHALERRGVDTPDEHIVVITSSTEAEAALATVLVKGTPWTPDEVRRTIDQVGVVPNSVLRYAPGHPVADDPATVIASADDAALDAWLDEYPYDVSPITDDSPFFWHFTSFADTISDFTSSIDPNDPEDAIGERVLVLLLAIGALLAAVFLLLPFLAIRTTWRALPAKARSGVYFSAIGLGFMFFEIALIQRLVLFLGYPTYSLTVTLASLLVFTGIGALLSGRIGGAIARVAPAVLVVLALLAAFYAFALPELVESWLSWPFAARVVVTFFVLAPLGVCLGTFMPLGLRAVAALSEHDDTYVAWSWAVNGFASVIGATLTTVLAMAFGFRIVFALAFVAYVVAVVALRGLTVASSATRPS
ncbi:MAG TPA: class I SAM-dependent methyltransferase [Acidimicrobiia bacterium]|nr:class I SAM-dependent methyltransferase [Acidimicrobiia bacterium]